MSTSRKRQSLSTIESLVNRLLVSTKHLLELLTQWARHEANDKYVLDAYVKLGNDFRAATRAFTSAGVDIRDIGDVPQALREILEAALSESPSQENLDRFLPNIRNIIVTLLQNLKAKQREAKQLTLTKEEVMASPTLRQASPFRHDPVAIRQERQEAASPSVRHSRKMTAESMDFVRERTALFSDRQINGSSGTRDDKDASSQPAATAATTSTSTPSFVASAPVATATTTASTPTITPPSTTPTPIINKEALAQLQKANVMQRRALKRFSAYQMARLTHDQVKHHLYVDTNEPPVPLTVLLSPHVPSSQFGAQLSPVDNEDEGELHHSQSSLSRVALSKRDPTQYLFLKIHGRTKKVFVDFPVSFTLLRLLFVEKFAYSPGGSTFPEIYLNDASTNVTYELEELMIDEVKPGLLLVLNEIDPNTSLIKDLLHKVLTLSTRVDGLSRDVVREVKDAVLSMEMPLMPVVVSKGVDANETVARELGQVLFEIKAIKQAQAKHKLAVGEVIQSIGDDVEKLRLLGLDSTGKDSTRSYMDACHQKLSEESDTLLTKVDDLQDVMEALRKDVAQRGVRVGDKQLKHTMKDIEDAKTALSDMVQYITKEKLVWKTIWEQELDKVCEEQQFFNLQDDLTQDLEEDLLKIQETFDLIEQCLSQQSRAPKKLKPFVVPLTSPGESLQNVKDAVLTQVALLVPNHEGRVEAIEKAEKLREREREINAQSKFQEELGDFVGEKKFKSSGGFDEIERIRKERDEENLRNGMGMV